MTDQTPSPKKGELNTETGAIDINGVQIDLPEPQEKPPEGIGIDMVKEELANAGAIEVTEITESEFNVNAVLPEEARQQVESELSADGVELLNEEDEKTDEQEDNAK